MSIFKKVLSISVLSSSIILLSACEQKPKPAVEENSKSNPIGQLGQTPIKAFATTPDDGHDIAILEDYDQRFTSMTDSMEIELAKMKQDNTLTPEFELQRQKDHVQSALHMLKEMELKTAQGRYIQGILAEYWENQATTLAQSKYEQDNQKQMQQLNQYLHAQSQLHHWKSITPDNKQMLPE